MPNESNPMSDMIEKYSKILVAFCMSIILIPTAILSIFNPSYNLIVWLIFELAICALAYDYFTHRYAQINTEINSNHSAQLMLTTLLSQYELRELEI
jgi:hypothetical protein